MLSLSNRRFRLSAFGGTRLETFQTELRCFHRETKNPRISYRLFKYLFVGLATLLLIPHAFSIG